MSPPAGPPIDETRLDRMTGGDEAQKVEVLALFTFEAPRLLDQVRAAATGPMQRERLGALERLARNIGATDLAEEARRAAGSAGEPDSLARLGTTLDVVMAYIGTSAGRSDTG